MRVLTLATTDLGDRSYVVTDGTVAVVIDPQRDLDRLDAILDVEAVTVAAVAETHIHNDYVTGGFALASRESADYLVSAHDDVAFDRQAVADGDRLAYGDLTVTVFATPGHTDHHLSFLVTDAGAPDEPGVLFTGGSMVFGGVGRTDLIAPDRTTELARAQWASVRRLAELPDETKVYPTHGFGSFCSVGAVGDHADDHSTIAVEKRRNQALVVDDVNRFVADLVAGLGAYPAYYAHMAGQNRGGPDEADLTEPRRLDPVELERRLRAGEWVVDLRDRIAYAADHLLGSISIAMGEQFATYVGWIIPYGASVTLVSGDRDGLLTARRQLSRIGIGDLAGIDYADAVAGPAAGLRTSYRRADFADLAREVGRDGAVASAPLTVLDVRRSDEHEARWIDSAVNIPIHELIERCDELPRALPVWVHCASGFRSAIAASILQRAGFDVVYLDDAIDHAVELGLCQQAVQPTA